jgi:sphingolipid delta-4 desaturase
MKEKVIKIKDYYWSEQKEPHFERRKLILQKHPEVKKLIGNDVRIAYITVGLVIIQLVSAIFIGTLFELNYGTFYFILYAYIIGATINQALFLAIHEITHNLALNKTTSNNWLALIANIPIVFPYAMSFKIYHLMHHRSQGKDGVDVDIPSRPEANIFQGFFGKTIWAFNQIIFYAVRPMMIHPIKINKWQVINIVTQICVMAVFFMFAGWNGLLYLLLSDFIEGSFHPVAGHFISEHYVFKKDQETYSYYGPLNKITFNVGYHNEHHDFPGIPGTRLPQLKKIANEFYKPLYSYKSWTAVIIHFIFDQTISLYSRIKRV